MGDAGPWVVLAAGVVTAMVLAAKMLAAVLGRKASKADEHKHDVCSRHSDQISDAQTRIAVLEERTSAIPRIEDKIDKLIQLNLERV